MIDHEPDCDPIESLAELIDRMVDGGLTPAQLRRGRARAGQYARRVAAVRSVVY